LKGRGLEEKRNGLAVAKKEEEVVVGGISQGGGLIREKADSSPEKDGGIERRGSAVNVPGSLGETG